MNSGGTLGRTNHPSFDRGRVTNITSEVSIATRPSPKTKQRFFGLSNRGAVPPKNSAVASNTEINVYWWLVWAASPDSYHSLSLSGSAASASARNGGL